MYLLDTNVLSEMRRPAPDSRVRAWFSQRSDSQLYVSVLTLGEIAKGISILRSRAEHARADDLQTWLDGVRKIHAERILPVSDAVALRWGKLAGEYKALPAIDGLLSATALEYGLMLITRNVRDMAVTGVPTLNPWE